MVVFEAMEVRGLVFLRLLFEVIGVVAVVDDDDLFTGLVAGDGLLVGASPDDVVGL